ncbi:hypothetical protein PFISCL1PPCAC_22087, partial [Pristionchus fissidentatus]
LFLSGIFYRQKFAMCLPLLKLPPEIVDHIFTLVDNKSRLALRAVCKQTRRIIDEAAKNHKRKPKIEFSIRLPIDFNPDAFKASVYVDCPIFLLPWMDIFNGRIMRTSCPLFQDRYVTLSKSELLDLIDSLEEPFKGCPNTVLHVSLLEEWNSNWLDLTFACSKKLNVKCLKINLVYDQCDMEKESSFFGILADDIATMIKPERIELHLEQGYSRDFLLRIADGSSFIVLHELQCSEDDRCPEVFVEMLNRQCSEIVVMGDIVLNMDGVDFFIQELTTLDKPIYFCMRVCGVEEEWCEKIGNFLVQIVHDESEPPIDGQIFGWFEITHDTLL